MYALLASLPMGLIIEQKTMVTAISAKLMFMYRLRLYKDNPRKRKITDSLTLLQMRET